MKKFFSVGVALALLGAGCLSSTPPAVQMAPVAPTQQPTSAKPMPTVDLRTELEQVYANVRLALEKNDADAYIALTEPAKNVDPAQLRAHWAEAVDVLKDIHPDLKTTKFLKLELQGDWGGYYRLTDLEDKNYITIELMLFHRVDGKWKLNGRTFGTSIRREEGVTDEVAIQKELTTNEGYKISTMINGK